MGGRCTPSSVHAPTLKSLTDLGNLCRLHTHDGSTGRLLSILREANPDIVFHLASMFIAEHTSESVADLVHSNVLFSTQLAEAMVGSGCKRLVNTGTSWQHFQSADYRPVNLYAATKQAFEDILVYYHDAHDLSVVTLKLFDTYGPGDRRGKLLDILVEAAMSGEPLDMSPGEQIVDLTHVNDVATAFLTAASLLGQSSEPLQECFFISGERYSIRELVKVVELATGRMVDARFGRKAYGIRAVMVPVTDSHRLPGWSPRTPLVKFLEDFRPGGRTCA